MNYPLRPPGEGPPGSQSPRPPPPPGFYPFPPFFPGQPNPAPPFIPPPYAAPAVAFIQPPPSMPLPPPRADTWLQEFLNRHKPTPSSFEWTRKNVKHILREIAVLIEELRNDAGDANREEFRAKQKRLDELLSIFYKDEASFVTFTNRELKLQRNKRWVKKRKAQKRKKREEEPSKEEVEKRTEQWRAQKEGELLSKVEAKRRKREERLLQRKKAREEKKLKYDMQLAARLEVLLHLRRSRTNGENQRNYFEELMKKQEQEDEKEEETRKMAANEASKTEATLQKLPEKGGVFEDTSLLRSYQQKLVEGELGGEGERAEKGEGTPEEAEKVAEEQEKGKEKATEEEEKEVAEEDEVERKRRREERRSQKRKREEELKAKEDKVWEKFNKFYNQADESLGKLIAIRQAWDRHLAPAGTPGSSGIPPYLVEPSPPSSEGWARYLTENVQKEGEEHREKKKRKRI